MKLGIGWYVETKPKYGVIFTYLFFRSVTLNNIKRAKRLQPASPKATQNGAAMVWKNYTKDQYILKATTLEDLSTSCLATNISKAIGHPPNMLKFHLN